MKRHNPLRKQITESSRVFGCWMSLLSPAAAEVLALAGFDIVLVDLEHGPGTIPDASDMMRAIQGHGAAAMVRVPANDPVFIKRLLDQGPDGVMIPMVETIEEAQAAVAACRYPPRGVRGWAAGSARASLYGFDESYTLQSANDLVIACQIESVRAVENIDAICAVEGIDIIFIGRNDLAASAGHLLGLDHPDVEKMVAKIVAAAKRAGKKIGTVPNRTRNSASLFADGFDVVVGPGDIGLLRDAALAELDAVRPSREGNSDGR